MKLNELITLAEFEKQLDHVLIREKNNIRTISDIVLSNDEYKYLKQKVKELKKSKMGIMAYEQYKLSLIIYMVHTLRKEETFKIHNKRSMKIMKDLKQHQVRYFINLCNNVFDEYGIDTFRRDIKSLDDLFVILYLHAGRLNHDDETYILDEQLLYSEKLKAYEKRMNELKFNVTSANRPNEKAIKKDQSKIYGTRINEAKTYEPISYEKKHEDQMYEENMFDTQEYDEEFYKIKNQKLEVV